MQMAQYHNLKIHEDDMTSDFLYQAIDTLQVGYGHGCEVPRTSLAASFPAVRRLVSGRKRERN